MCLAPAGGGRNFIASFWATGKDELRKCLRKIHEKSLEFHASNNHFSNWLAVRGEFSLASEIRPVKISDFGTLNELRAYIIERIDIRIQALLNGQIVEYSTASKYESINFIRLASGSLGGKARGLAFMNHMLMENELNTKYSNIRIRIPKVAVIGTDEFDHFMDDNNLWKIAFSKTQTEADRPARGYSPCASRATRNPM